MSGGIFIRIKKILLISVAACMMLVSTLSACSKVMPDEKVSLEEFSSLISFSDCETEFSGNLEYVSPLQISFTVENPVELKGMVVEESNGEKRAKLGDAYVSLDKAEILFESSSCLSELFEILGSMGNEVFELSNDRTVSGKCESGEYKAEFSEGGCIPNYIETEFHRYVFESADKLPA